MRYPIGFAIGLLLASTLVLTRPAHTQDKTGKNVLLALEQTLEDVIKKTENSVACVLVSRSTVYRDKFDDRPPPDQPHKLGAFDPANKQAPEFNNMGRFGGRRGFQQPDRLGARRYDLSHSQYIPESYGSGLVIDGEKLLILTTYHQIRDATKIYVRLPGDKGSYADIQATDPQRDLAVLVLIDKSIKNLKPVKFGDGGSVRKGQFVVALANPHATSARDGSPSASWGIVSNIQRRATTRTTEADAGFLDNQEPTTTYTVGDYIRTDAQILAGSSGGALVNLQGEVIGLISARAAVSGLEGNGGLAMPINKETKSHIESLREGKEVEHGFLGISTDREGNRGEGAVIRQVTFGSPAQLAGIAPNDCIIAVNGTPIHDFDDLLLAISAQKAGSEVRLEMRNRRPAIVTAKLGKAYVPGIIASNRPKPVRGIRVDYATATAIQLSLDTRTNLPSLPTHGVSVADVVSKSSADNARIQVGAIITEVNGTAVNDPAQFYAAANKVPAGKPLILKLQADAQRAKEDLVVTIP